MAFYLSFGSENTIYTIRGGIGQRASSVESGKKSVLQSNQAGDIYDVSVHDP